VKNKQKRTQFCTLKINKRRWKERRINKIFPHFLMLRKNKK